MFRILNWNDDSLVAIASTFSEALRVCDYFQSTTKLPHYIREIL
jgi:hypothetical protein